MMEEKSLEELREIVGLGHAAEREINRRHTVTADLVKERLSRVQHGDKSAAFTDDELVYAARDRCECGAGLAYPIKTGMHGSWECSDILTLRALQKAEEGSVMHTAPLPFAFYSIKSEKNPSVGGATTRKPQGE
jgi:hypothetical protein